MSTYGSIYSNTDLRGYFSRIRKYKPLSKEEEMALIQLAQKGDMGARNKIIQAHLKYVVNIAKRFVNSGLALEDLIAEGNIGLIKAIDKFDTTRNVKFISCAMWWIRQSIQYALKDVKQYNSTHIREEMTDEDEIDGICEARWEDESIKYDESDCFIDTPNNLNAEEINDFSFSEIRIIMDEALDERTRYVIMKNLGMNGYTETPLADIAKEIGISKERTRQIRDKAMKIIRCEVLKRSLSYVSI